MTPTDGPSSRARTGLVVVSHSHALADAARALAAEMGAGAPIELAAGLDESTFGTDATAVAAAIETAFSAVSGSVSQAAETGVVVLLDLGSAVLSAEMALELLDPDLAERVTISPAPLVEGLVVAAVAAAGGASRAKVAAEAERALDAKRGALGDGGPDAAPDDAVPTDDAADHTADDADAADEADEADEADAPTAEVALEILDPAGLHARPAALIAARAEAAEARVEASGDTGDTGEVVGPVAADSMLELMTLGLAAGSVLRLRAVGPGAAETLDAIAEIVRTEVNGPHA